ncbi:hypothetical protein EEL30_21985 [Brevibacillus laterosporus]|uniref:DUF3221 domain-containing protein n=1 Tax=Brevibacillus laterosporus TaxID=1465 RepID=A0A518VCL0_BRELA|nr:hypothetical protein EEL30_21985 [Brevibacillus laterosporus]
MSNFKLALSMFVLVTAAVFNQQNVSACNQYTTFTYEVTQIDNDQFYGTGVNDNSNIYFLEENVKQSNTIKVGDVVVAYFDPSNIEDGLMRVENAESITVGK